MKKKFSTSLKKYIFIIVLSTTLLNFFAIHAIANSPSLNNKTKINNIGSMDSKTAYGDRIIFGSLGEASNLIPYISSDAASHEIAGLIFIALLRYDKDLKIEPFAAKSYEVLDEGRILRFTLHEGILWEDGVELTTDDIEFTWKLITNPKTASPYAEMFMAVKEFKKTGKYTFEVHYEQYFAKAITSWMSAILPKHILEGQDIHTTAFARKPIGAGPYKLKKWVHGSQITLQASETYFEGKPFINEIIYRIIPDISTMFMETKAEKLDMMGLTPQQYLRQTDGPPWDKEFHKYKYLASMYVYLGFNLKHHFFKDVKVRQAISAAINRNDITKGVLLGEGMPTIGPYKPGSWAYNDKIQPVSYDPEKAKRLLKEAGFADLDNDGIIEKDGKPFIFTILTNQGNEQRILTATVIQYQLKHLGIKVQIRTVEWAAFIKEFVNKGKFDTVLLGWTITQDPDIFDVWHSSKIGNGGLNFIQYENAQLDSLLIEARSIPEQDKRKILYDKIQEILHKEQPYCFLYVPYALPIIQSRFRGIKPALAGIMYNFDKWWVPKELQRFQP